MSEIKRVSSEAFRKLIEGNPEETGEGCAVSKFVVADAVEKAKSDDGRETFRFVFSTGAQDREGDIIRQKGWKLKNFKAAGSPVLYAHNPGNPPIGRALSMKVEDEKLRGEVRFFSRDEYKAELSEQIESLVRLGALRATSVGFLPIKFEVNRNEDGDFLGFNFLEQDLLEGSIVPIPANPEAIRERCKGIDLAPVIEWHEQQLDGDAGCLYVPKDIVENSWSKLKEAKAISAGAPENKGALSWGDSHPDGTQAADRETEWDGSQQVADADVDDLRVMSAWVDSDNAENKGAYKLPHHNADDKATVWRGVTAAMGALLGARGGVDIPDDDRQGVYNHLARHYREDFDEEPPELRAYDADEIEKLFPSGAVDHAADSTEGDNGTPAENDETPASRLVVQARAFLAACMELDREFELSDDDLDLIRTCKSMAGDIVEDYLELADDDDALEAQESDANDDDGEDYLDIEDNEEFAADLRASVKQSLHESIVEPLTGKLS